MDLNLRFAVPPVTRGGHTASFLTPARGAFTYLNTAQAAAGGSVTLLRSGRRGRVSHCGELPSSPPPQHTPGTFLRAARNSRCCGVSPTPPPSRRPELPPRRGAAPPCSAEAKRAQRPPPRSAMAAACPPPRCSAPLRRRPRPGPDEL